MSDPLNHQKPHYKIITGYSNCARTDGRFQFEIEIIRYLESGWRCAGGLSVIELDETVYFYQAMTFGLPFGGQ